MAISTYTELQAAVGNWLGRDDLTNRIPEFIQGGEIRIQDDVRVPALATTTDVTVASGVSSVTLSSDFLELASPPILHDASTNRYMLDPRPYATVTFNYGTTTTGIPTQYAILADKMYFNYAADADYTLKLTAYTRSFLGGAVTTNWYTTNYPMALLYSALLESAMYTEEDPSTYKALYDEQINRIRSYVDRQAKQNWSLPEETSK